VQAIEVEHAPACGLDVDSDGRLLAFLQIQRPLVQRNAPALNGSERVRHLHSRPRECKDDDGGRTGDPPAPSLRRVEGEHQARDDETGGKHSQAES
jgi:hypothetical protein